MSNNWCISYLNFCIFGVVCIILIEPESGGGILGAKYVLKRLHNYNFYPPDAAAQILCITVFLYFVYFEYFCIDIYGGCID